MTDRLIWPVLAIFAAFNVAKPWLVDTPVQVLLPLVSILGPVLFVLLHAPRQIGWKNLGTFFLLTFVISWGYESLSIATGFPFGHYHYTDNLGPKLGTVPLLIMPAYFGVCYISWQIARLLTSSAPSRSFRGPVVLVAAFVMVMWDLSMDPSRATIARAWIWHDGGAYFGVPFENFVGWFLCVATIFAAFSFWLSRSDAALDHGRAAKVAALRSSAGGLCPRPTSDARGAVHEAGGRDPAAALASAEDGATSRTDSLSAYRTDGPQPSSPAVPQLRWIILIFSESLVSQ